MPPRPTTTAATATSNEFTGSNFKPVPHSSPICSAKALTGAADNADWEDEVYEDASTGDDGELFGGETASAAAGGAQYDNSNSKCKTSDNNKQPQCDSVTRRRATAAATTQAAGRHFCASRAEQVEHANDYRQQQHCLVANERTARPATSTTTTTKRRSHLVRHHEHFGHDHFVCYRPTAAAAAFSATTTAETEKFRHSAYFGEHWPRYLQPSSLVN